MNMEMYWAQQEVFLMGVLSLFPEKLKKSLPITLDGEWYYFNAKNEDELAQQLYKYKKAGYIEYDEVPLLVTYIGSPPDPDDEINFRSAPRGYLIRSVDSQKATDDLTLYLENWNSDKLATRAAHKPDDHKYQNEKLLAALEKALKSQSIPHINGADVYGDPVNTYYDYQPPFWETVLAPQLVDGLYNILQMDYDLKDRGQPYVSIKITDQELLRSLELAANSSEPISDDEPKELMHLGLRIKRDGLVDYNGVDIPLTGQQTTALRVLMQRPGELRLREDFAIELSKKNKKPENMAKLISKLRGDLLVVLGYNCIENRSGQGWKLIIRRTE